MFGITDFWTYLAGALFVVLIPGPNSLYVIALAAQHGARSAYRAAYGIFLGDTILMSLTVAGAASLLRTTPQLFVAFKLVGAIYLSWMGVKLLYTTVCKLRQPEAAPLKEVPIQSHKPFTKALLISLLNPKAIFFFLSFFIQFVDPTYQYPILSFTLLGLVLQTFSMIYLSILIFSGVRLATLFRRGRWLAASANSAAGALFIGFGIKLASTSIS